jgi:predicted transcriptional regulator
MNTDLETVLSIIRKNKVKRIKQGMTMDEFAIEIDRSVRTAQKVMSALVEDGLAMFVGRELQPTVCGGFKSVPLYKLKTKK